MANGYPLSAVVGGNEIMQKVEDIFFSGTFGGETLSLVAANTVIDKYKKDNVPKYLNDLGNYLLKKLNQLIINEGLDDIFRTSGHPAWSFLQVKAQDKYTALEIKTLFLQEMFKNGILILSSHNLNFSHSEEDIDKLISVYSEVLPLIKQSIDDGNLIEQLNCKPLQPLFQVR
jgi:glutamate-1-semialdehyde 2,1-aminomutase